MAHSPPRLFLVDGYALIYRAFFAMLSRPLRTSRGENTSAAWGVANFLVRLREKYRPDYLAWVNDAGDSFRTELYPDYKSTREKLDAELQADFDRAVERVAELLAAFRVPLVAFDGYEADDVIGTLATRGAARGWHVVIVSGDKDFYQLIGPRSPCSIPAGAGRPGSTSNGSTSTTPPSDWACRRRRWSTTCPWSATAPTTCRASRGSERREPRPCSRSSATSTPCWPAPARSRASGRGRRW